MRNLTLFPILEETFSFFLIKYDISCMFVIYPLYYFEIHSFYTKYVKRVYNERMLCAGAVVKCFSASIEVTVIFTFCLIVTINYIYWFMCVESSFLLRDKTHFVMVYNHFGVFLNLVCYYFVENVCCIIGTLMYNFLLLWYPYLS